MVVLSTTTATLVGFVYAVAISRPELRGRRALRLIATLPLFSPPFTLGFSFLLMYGRFGLISHNVLGFEASILGWKSLWAVQNSHPFSVCSTRDRTSTRNHAGKARSSSPEPRGQRGYGLQDSYPAVGAACNRRRSTSDSNLRVGRFRQPAGHWRRLSVVGDRSVVRIDGWGDIRGAALLAATLLPPALLFFVAERFWVSQRNYSVISGRGGAFARLPLPRLVTWALIAICVVIATLILSLYFGIIAGAFTETWGVDWTPTFDQWPVAFSKSDHLRNSVVYAATAGLAATFFAMPAAFLVDQRAIPIRRTVDFLCVLPAAVPGVFIGIGYLLFFGGTPLAGTAALMISAFTFANIPFSYQVLRSGLAQIDHNLAGRPRISAPRVCVSSGISIFACFGRHVSRLGRQPSSAASPISASRSFLVTSGTQVTTFSILGLIGDNRLEAASALTTALLAITMVTVLIAWRVSRTPRLLSVVVDA